MTDATEHESLCSHDTHPYPATCETCVLIRKVRADERAKARSRVARLPVERRSPRGVALVERVRVLALLDGSNDDHA